MSYVSHFFTREMYLRAYALSIEALRGEDFWESHNAAEMLPPHVPKKLRGRPKKMRRREEWEGRTQSRSQTESAVEEQGEPGVKRFNQGRIVHCSICKKADHKRTTCPTKDAPMNDNARPET